MNLKFISADNPLINYMGRIDYSDKASPLLIYAGSNLRFRFSGSSLTLSLKNVKMYDQPISAGYIIDGVEGKFMITEHTKSFEVKIPIDNDKPEHSFILFKRQDGTHYLNFNGFYIDENADILPQPPLPSRKIEAYGDSICVGSWCELIEHLGKSDPEEFSTAYDNSWHSFVMVASRLLNAQINNIAQGGMAVISGTGWNYMPYFSGLDAVYDKLRNVPYLETSEWDFSRYTPHLVILALGQNDNHKDGCPDFDINDKEYRENWKKKYSDIIKDLMLKYPKAHFILAMTIMKHDLQRDVAIDEIAADINSERIHRLRFTRNAAACNGHPRIPEQAEMAVELTEYINSLGDEIWQD